MCIRDSGQTDCTEISIRSESQELQQRDKSYSHRENACMRAPSSELAFSLQFLLFILKFLLFILSIFTFFLSSIGGVE